jgi:hypothetical protein
MSLHHWLTWLIWLPLLDAAAGLLDVTGCGAMILQYQMRPMYTWGTADPFSNFVGPAIVYSDCTPSSVRTP